METNLWILPIAFPSIAIGILSCFFGYRLFKLIIGIVGFILAAGLAASLCWTFLTQNQLVVLATGLVGGIVGALSLVFLYYLGIFVAGAILGGLIASVLSGSTTIDPAVFSILLAITGGVLAVILQKVVIILSTAVSGAWAVVCGAASAAGLADAALLYGSPLTSVRQLSAWLLIAWVILAALGLSTQFSSDRRSTGRKQRRQEAAD